jgi:hypothetical protein
MTGYSHRVLVEGRYQIVALSHQPALDPRGLFAYAVATLDDARLWQGLSLGDAREWLQVLLDGDALAAAPAVPARKRVARR